MAPVVWIWNNFLVKNARPHIWTLKTAAAWIAVLPFVLLTFMAPGTMPTRTAGGIELVLCTSNGVETIALGPDGTPVDKSHEPCFWGVPLESVALLDHAAPLVAVATQFRAYELPKPQITQDRIAANDNAARAPPSFL